jgi:DNA-directed RNA polymerase specialized sigma24 family protein
MTKPSSCCGADWSAGADFRTTHWSMVLAAGQSESPQTAAAMEELCRDYWFPLYAYARRRGQSVHDAQDLTQEFFSRLVQHNTFAHLSREKGRFRSYLLSAFQYFMSGEWDRARAQKRGGGQPVISLDAAQAETRYGLEQATEASPERAFDRRWALTLMERAMVLLRGEFEAAGKGGQFEALKGFLSREAASAEYQSIAVRLSLSPSAVAVAVHRLRQRYGEMVRIQVAQTVATPADLEEELRYLFAQ